MCLVWVGKESCKQIIKMQGDRGSKRCMSLLLGEALGGASPFALWDKEKVRESLPEEKTLKQNLGRRFSV